MKTMSGRWTDIDDYLFAHCVSTSFDLFSLHLIHYYIFSFVHPSFSCITGRIWINVFLLDIFFILFCWNQRKTILNWLFFLFYKLSFAFLSFDYGCFISCFVEGFFILVSYCVWCNMNWRTKSIIWWHLIASFSRESIMDKTFTQRFTIECI